MGGDRPRIGVCTFLHRQFKVPLSSMKRVADSQRVSGSNSPNTNCKGENAAKALHEGGSKEEIAFDRSSGCSRAGNWFPRTSLRSCMCEVRPSGRSAFIPAR